MINDDIHICQSVLLEEVYKFRAKHPLLKGGDIAIIQSDLTQFLLLITALDGWCRKLVILSDSLNDNLLEDILHTVNCNYLLVGNTCTEVVPFSPQAVAKQTQWVITTSGTTGKPKLISHNLKSLIKTLKYSPVNGDKYRWGLLYDPARFAGLQVVLQSLLNGSLLVPVYKHNNPVQMLVKQNVNAVSATPSMWRKLLMSADIEELRLKQITLGGETADALLLSLLSSYFPNSRCVHIYASTEVGVGFAVTDGLAGFPAEWLKGAEAKIKIGLDNHLLLKQSNQNCYIDTEDLVEVCGDRVYFLGRVSGTINVGGDKVQPQYVEEVIRQLPFIADTRVFGKKSPILGELVAAEIILNPTDLDTKVLRGKILQHCKVKLLKYQIPISIIFTDSIKLTEAGKISRH